MRKRLRLNCGLKQFQKALNVKIGMSDSQRYPEKLCLIKNDEDAFVIFENG